MGNYKPGFECHYISTYRKRGPPGPPFIFREYKNRNGEYRNTGNTSGEILIRIEKSGTFKICA
jgi:hypothetical protein